MSVRTFLAVASIALGSGCASVDERRANDARAVGARLQERTGLELALSADDGGAIEPATLELLEQPLDENAALRIALSNNRDVRAALARAGVASAERIQAGLLDNPVLAADAKFFSDGTEIELGIAESFFDLFFLSARARVAESELEAAKARIARELVRLVHDVRRALVRVRAAERLVQVEREVLRAAQASVELMTELHRAGNVTDPRLTAEQLALARAKLAVARAEADSAETRETLNVLLGLWGSAVSWTVAGELSTDTATGLDLERVESRAIAASLDLAEIRAEATARARIAGIVGWEAVLAPGEIGIAVKRESGNSKWGAGPALGFSLPVFDSGRAREAGATARLEESLARHVSRAVEIRSAARRLRERAVALHDRARFIREEELPTAGRLLRETLRNYNAMQVGAFDVLLAKQQETETARRHVETLRDAWLARLDLEELLAGSLDEECAAHAGPTASARAPATSMQERH